MFSSHASTSNWISYQPFLRWNYFDICCEQIELKENRRVCDFHALFPRHAGVRCVGKMQKLREKCVTRNKFKIKFLFPIYRNPRHRCRRSLLTFSHVLVLKQYPLFSLHMPAKDVKICNKFSHRNYFLLIRNVPRSSFFLFLLENKYRFVKPNKYLSEGLPNRAASTTTRRRRGTSM